MISNRTTAIARSATILAILALIGITTAARATSSGRSRSSVSLDKIISADQILPSTTLSAPPISTNRPNQLVVAMLASDGPWDAQRFTSVTGGGLQWTPVARANSQPGVAEIWQAVAPNPGTQVAVTATRDVGAWVGSITVASFNGASRALGTARSAGAGPPSVTLRTTSAGSLIYAVGDDWDTATRRTPGSNQALVHQHLSPTNDTYWIQRLRGSTSGAGKAVTINSVAPSQDRFNMAAVEISPGPATVAAGEPATSDPTTTTPPTTISPSTTSSTTTPSSTAPPTTKPPTSTPPPTTPPTGTPSGSNTGPGWCGFNGAANCAWPGKGNTGVKTASALTRPVSNSPDYSWNGRTLSITKPNVHLDSMEIPGQVFVSAPGAVITNSRIDNPGYFDSTDNIILVDFRNPQAYLTITDSEAYTTSDPTRACGAVIGESQFTAIRDYFHDCQGDVAHPNGNATISDSWLLLNQNLNTGAHSDIIQITEGSNINIVHNQLDASIENATSGIMVGTDQGSVSNIKIQKNRINGGGFAFYGGQCSSCQYQVSPPVVYSQNRFQRAPEPGGFWPNGGTKGPIAYVNLPGQPFDYTSNVWDDNGGSLGTPYG